MTQEIKSHRFWLDESGKVVREEGNLFTNQLIDEFSPKLICPILVSIYSDILKSTPKSPIIYIPKVNLSNTWINGFFDYFLSKTKEGLVLWELKDMTETTNNKLVRLQPEMEEKLKKETTIFLKSDRTCNTNPDE